MRLHREIERTLSTGGAHETRLLFHQQEIRQRIVHVRRKGQRSMRRLFYVGLRQGSVPSGSARSRKCKIEYTAAFGMGPRRDERIDEWLNSIFTLFIIYLHSPTQMINLRMS